MVDGGEPGVDSKDEGKHTGRNDLLFVEKMMWMGYRKQIARHFLVRCSVLRSKDVCSEHIGR